jgi:predicted peptidase
MELVDEFVQTHPIDRSRIYLVGLSMGGFAVWDLLARHPERFAAAIEIAGGAPREIASSIKSIPVWVFHNEGDTIVPVSRADQVVEELKKSGGNVKYTRYPKPLPPIWDHDSWTAAFLEPDFFSWLFAQKKEEK